MCIKSLKYLFSLLVSLYLFNQISSEILINFKQLKIILDEIYILLFIILIFFPIFYLLSIKLIYLVDYIKKVKFYDSYKTTLITYTYNLILPAKSGDLFRHKYLNLKINFKDFFRINLIEKLISFFVLLVLVFFSYLTSNLDIKRIINIDKVYINTFFLIVVFLCLISLKVLIKDDKNLSIKVKNLIFFDILIWCFQFFQIFLIIKLLDIEITIFDTIFIFGIAIISGLIPISIGGFGVRDYIIFLLFSNFEIDGNLFLILLLFNLKYILPIIKSFFVSLYDLYKLKIEILKKNK